MMKFVSTFLPSLVVLSIFTVSSSCGKKSSDGEDSPPTPAPTPTVVPTELPETPPLPFWLTNSPKDGGGPVAVRFDSTGRLSLTIDLMESGLDYGPITALHFFDSSTLMFFIDAGASKETIGSLDVKTALVKNKAWGAEASIKAAFNGVRANSFVTGFQTSVLHAQTATGIKALRYNADGGLRAETFYDGASDAAADCPLGTVTSSALIQAGGTAYLAVLSSGSATRLNVLTIQAGKAKCKTSLDYSQGSDATAQHKAVNLAQTIDGKIFLLLQHTSDPMVLRYDFDGNSLTNPQTIYKGLSNLGPTPLGLIARTSKRLIIGRPDVPALIEIQLKGNESEQTDFYKKTSFAKDLTALISEPAL
jgi:hypothetical protein